jgi:hypothetical protein
VSYLAEISEAEASGTVAEVYAAIRRAFGLPVVMLVYRHLATVPGRLQAVWSELEPNLSDAAIDAAAAELTEVAVARVAAITPATIDAIGIAPRELEQVRTTVDAYAYANPRNLVAARALLDGAPGTGRRALPAGKRTCAGELLPMVSLEELDPPVRALLEELSGPFSGRGEGLLVPSLFRHLASRPDLLALTWAVLRPLAKGRELARRANLLRARAGALAAALPSPVMRVEEAGARRAVERFSITIARMTVATAALRDALPR